MRTPNITVYRIRGTRPNGTAYAEWRWTWTATNGRVIAASTEGYAARAKAIDNLRQVTGGTITLTYRIRTPQGWYHQGTWQRGTETLFLSVTP